MSNRAAGLETQRSGERSTYGRDFLLYAAGRSVSVVGDRIAAIALVFLIINLARSFAPAVAVFYVCRTLPYVAGGLLVGVLVDHFNRQRLMVACDLSRCVLVAAVPLLAVINLWSIYPIAIALFALTLVFDTAARAAVPDVVTEQQLTGANAILNGIETAGDFAYAAGGALIYVFKLQAPFYIDAVTFLVSAVMVAGMRFPKQKQGPFPHFGQTHSMIREGIAYLVGQPFLRWSTVTFTVAPLAGGAILVVTPLYAQHVLGVSAGLIGPLHSGAFRFSVLEVTLGAGALIGTRALSALAARTPRGLLFAVGAAGMGCAYLPLALTTNLYVAATFLAVAGFFHSLFVITGITLAQELTPSEMRGRVTAARITATTAGLTLGAALSGPALVVMPYQALWLLLGAIIVASGVGYLQPEVRSQA